MTTPGAAAPSQAEKARTFRTLHERGGAFIIPNPWDVGTARLLAHLGFEALATTSMGYAFSLGRLDNSLNCDETLTNASAIASATPLPVSADLENGFGDAPEVVAAISARVNSVCLPLSVSTVSCCPRSNPV